jgi:hypothetical protein
LPDAGDSAQGEGFNGLFGIDVSGLPESEVVQKIGFSLASLAVKEITARPTQMEVKMALENNPGLLLSKKGSLFMTDIMRQSAKQDMKLARLANDPKNRANWPEVVDKFYNDPKNELISPFTGKPMSVEDVKTLQSQPGQQQPAAPAQPPMFHNAGELKTAISAGTVRSGDTVIVLNPATGQYEAATVKEQRRQQ